MVNKESTNKEEMQIGEKEAESPQVREEEPHEQELIKELEATKKQLDEEKDRCLLMSAEFDNFRKRTLKEREEFVKYANEKLVLELLDVYESLERGLDTKEKDNSEKLLEGMELIYKQFKNVLEKNGLAPIKALGEKFDPYKHEAMMQTLTDEYDDGIVLEELARGYMLNKRVIRYSKVRVSKRKEEIEKVK